MTQRQKLMVAIRDYSQASVDVASIIGDDEAEMLELYADHLDD